MRPAAFMVLVLLTCAGHARAQAVDPEYDKDTRRLLEMTGAQRLGQQMLDSVLNAVGQSLRQANPNIPQRVVDIAAGTAKELYNSEMGSLMPRIVLAYSKVLTHDEVRQMIAFYETPLGKRIIEVMPQLQQAANQAGQEGAQSHAPKLQEMVQQRLKTEGLIP